MPVGKKKSFWPVVIIGLMLLFFASSLVMALDNTPATPAQKPVEPLPVVGSIDNLKKLLVEYEKSSKINSGQLLLKESKMKMMNDTAAVAPMARDEMAGGAAVNLARESAKSLVAASTDYSSTNVQVQGVDEADIVKSDGNYIYQVNQQEIVVIKAIPAEQMQVVSRIKLDNHGFTPRELFLDSKHLVVIGDSHDEIYARSMPKRKAEIYPPPVYRQPGILALIYDITDKNQIKKTRELELEGNYLSSRKIGSHLYLVSNRHLDWYRIQEKEENILPSYRDTAVSSDFKQIDCGQINYFPGEIYPAYIIIAAVDINRNEPAQVKTCLGNGENIYASINHLYIAVSRQEPARPLLKDSDFPSPDAEIGPKTRIYRFGLQQGKVEYQGKGEVPGRILNQFSMDEEKAYFRIATTSGEIWRNDENTSKNNLYVLDQEMNIAGKLEGIAPGEQIYSTRFMGDRAYMVTFRTVDPLFVIDLKDPAKPAILGKLKIPGYSDYLHPYDENHIIGFGKETIELKGRNNEAQAFYQGMKIALFDVSDVNNPREMSREIIGDRGTDSELLRDHKALLFSREKNLLAFPVTVMTLSEADKNRARADFPAYGKFSFQGAYVYKIDLQHGFQLQGRISHLSPADYQRAGDYWCEDSKNIQRIIFIGKNLYTLSQSLAKSHQITDLKEVGSLYLR